MVGERMIVDDFGQQPMLPITVGNPKPSIAGW